MGHANSSEDPMRKPELLRRPRALIVSFGMYMHITSTEIQSCVPTLTRLVNGIETEPLELGGSDPDDGSMNHASQGVTELRFLRS
jgi:hypothetical protein